MSATSPDLDVVAALLRRDERAFVELVTRYQASMKRIARMYVATDALADEVVQEAWEGVLKGLPRFEGRSSASCPPAIRGCARPSRPSPAT